MLSWSPATQALWHNVAQCNYEACETALQDGADVTSRHPVSNRTLLQTREVLTNVSLTRLLLQYGASAKPEPTFEHPLCLACERYSSPVEVIRLLLQAGSTISKDLLFRTIVFHRQPATVVPLLLAYGADGHHTTKNGTLLMITHDPEVMRALLEAGGDYTLVDHRGRCVLQQILHILHFNDLHPVSKKNIELILRLLIQAGARWQRSSQESYQAVYDKAWREWDTWRTQAGQVLREALAETSLFVPPFSQEVIAYYLWGL